MRLGTPINKRGPAKARWAAWQQKSKMAVRFRTHGVCEGCGSNMRPLDFAHLAGRNNKGIGEPWASCPELCAGLCSSGYGVVGCHAKIDRALDLELLERLRWTACYRMETRFSLDLILLDTVPSLQVAAALDVIRELVRMAEERYEWDGVGIVRRVREMPESLFDSGKIEGNVDLARHPHTESI